MPDLPSLILDAAERRFPPVDGGWTRVDPWRPGLYAVVAFTGHAAISAPPEVTDADLAAWGADGFGGATLPAFMQQLVGPDGWTDFLDVLLVARGTGPAEHPHLVRRPDLASHARAGLARALRDEVTVYGRPDGDDVIVTMSHGVAGLHEMSYELQAKGVGGGSQLAAEALTLVPEGSVVLASVAPGNAASLRALLRAGFEPIGSVQLYTRGPSPLA